MNSVSALSVGSAVSYILSSTLTGHVHSVFKKVLNILVQDEVVSLIQGKSFGLPNGVIIPEDSLFTDIWILPGMKATICNGILRIDEADYQINLINASIFSSYRELGTNRQPETEIINRLSNFADECRKATSTNGFGPIWFTTEAIFNDTCLSLQNPSTICIKAYPLIQEMIDGIRKINYQKIFNSAKYLSGLGVGLTPSGDDFLIGLVSSISLLKSYISETEYTRFCTSVLDAARGRSNQISWTYLVHAMKSEISEPIFCFIECITVAKSINIRKTVSKLFSFGATSGSELGLGAYTGIRILQEKQNGYSYHYS